MKVYIITISEVSGGCDLYNKPMAFDSREKAMTELEKMRVEYNEQFSEKYKREFYDDSIEFYIDGEYSVDHWSAVIHEVEVQ